MARSTFNINGRTTFFPAMVISFGMLTAGLAKGPEMEPEELVGAAIYLASPSAGATTGHLLIVDGGWTAL